MNRDPFWQGLFALTMLLGGVVIGLPNKHQSFILDSADKVIAECQKDLPRSQVCELTAKVKEGKE